MIGTPISIFSAWLCRIWELLTQQGVCGPVLSVILRRCFCHSGGLLTYASRCDLQSAMLVERLTNPVVAPKPRKRRRRPRPASCLRRFRCYHCGAYVNVCAPCDRGQRYCSPSCRDTARAAAVRVAGSIYQRSDRGREKHAARQRAYWARRRAKQLSGEPSTSPVVPTLRRPRRLGLVCVVSRPIAASPATASTERVVPALRFRIPAAPQPHGPASPALRTAPCTNEPCCFVCAAPSHYWLSDYGKRTRYHRSRSP
jgi:hypothetical protein